MNVSFFNRLYIHRLRYPPLHEWLLTDQESLLLDDHFVMKASLTTVPVPTKQYRTYRDKIKYICNKLLICIMTSSNGNIYRVTGPLCGEFTGLGEFPAQSPVTRNFDVFFDLRPNERLSKQPWGLWFETPSWSLCRHCNDLIETY